MDDATLRGELEYWLCETHSWPCSCQSLSAPVQYAPVVLCDHCQIHTSLDAAAAHARHDEWPAAHRAILSAARIEGRLDSLRDAIGLLANPEDAAPYEELEVTAMGTGPMRLPGPREAEPRAEATRDIEEALADLKETADAVQEDERHPDPDDLYPCGLTWAQHREICDDVIRREEEMVKAGQFYDEKKGVQWQMGTHSPGCHSTFCWPLHDRRDWTPPEVERANRRARVEELARGMEERLADDPQRLIVREWLGLPPAEE
jgi:hypothetical protein